MDSETGVAHFVTFAGGMEGNISVRDPNAT
jgi:hypothetical protein